jgi:hypothetical protein
MIREPLLKKGALLAALGPTLALLAVFGLPLTDAQTKAVLAAVAAWLPILTALWARGDVTPVADPRSADGAPLVVEEQDY